MKVKYSLLSFFIFLISFTVSAQDSQLALMNDIRAEGQRISEIMEWDSSFTEQLNLVLLQAQRENKESEYSQVLLERLWAHYQVIQSNNKSRVKLPFEESILNWINPLIVFMSDKENSTNKIIRGFPDTYYPVKTLAPELLTDLAKQDIADRFPKEVMHMVRYMITVDELPEIEYAALNAPYEAKQYLHYSNNVNRALKASDDDRINTLLSIYSKYRYGSKSFYLLDLIHNKDLEIQEAHELAKEREKLYNALVSIYKKDNAIGKQSVVEKLSESI